jgi:phosphate transport system substrate-binding protein
MSGSPRSPSDSGTAVPTPSFVSSNSATEGDLARVRKRNRTPVLLGAIVVVLVVVAVVGWGVTAGGWFKPSGGGAGCPTNPQPLTGAGSTFVYPVMNTWVVQYQSACGVDVNYQAVGSSSGITSLEDKAVDFGASDAPLNPIQRAALPAPTVTIPETSGGVVLLYNLPTLLAPLNLNGSVIAGIFLGTITNWSDPEIAALNPGVSIPAGPITTVHRLDGSGTTFAFTSYLSDESSTWSNEYGRGLSVQWPVGLAAKGSSGIAGVVAVTVGSIGYDEYAYASLNHLTYAAVQNNAGNIVLANLTNVQTAVDEGATGLPSGTGDWYNVSLLNEPGAQTYPIVTFTYLIVYLDLSLVYGSSMSAATAASLGHFIYWVLTSGQSYSAGVFYVPLPANVISLDETTLGQITYNAAPISTH